MHISKVCHKYQLFSLSKKDMGEMYQGCKTDIEKPLKYSDEWKTSKCCFLDFDVLAAQIRLAYVSIISHFFNAKRSEYDKGQAPAACWEHFLRGSGFIARILESQEFLSWDSPGSLSKGPWIPPGSLFLLAFFIQFSFLNFSFAVLIIELLYGSLFLPAFFSSMNQIMSIIQPIWNWLIS